MKKVELLGLSVVAAALIMTTGCSSDSNDNGTPAASAPSEIAGAMEMNATSAKNAIYAIRDGGASSAPARRAARKAASAKRAASHRAPSSSDNGTETYDCDISGTETDTWTSSSTGDTYNSDGTSWSSSSTYTTTYNNCIEDYGTTTINGEPVNQYMYDGTYSYTSSDNYNADTNKSTSHYTWSDNYKEGWENNETETSQIYTYAQSGTEDYYWDGEYYHSWNSAEATYKDTWSDNGEDSRVDTNSTGSKVYGYKNVYGNKTGSEEGVQDYSHGKSTQNGFYARYDINASGEWELSNASSFVNFKTEYSEAGNESNFTVSGGYGDTCLGGTVTYSTTTGVQENQADYFDGDDSTGSNVLPYKGAITMSGTSTASVAFSSNDTNHTSALLNVGGADENLTRWSDLSIQNCVN